jgi:ABC-type uncharacterized transport system fused permease/ATPase subunit
VVALTLGTTGVSVLFNFLGRDFFNALAERDADRFARQLAAYLGGFAVGVPVYVLRSYFQSRLALEWREGMTRSLLASYMSDRAFYQLASGGVPAEGGGGAARDGGGGAPSRAAPAAAAAAAAAASVDNPDQRIASDVRAFTDTCLSLALTLLNAGVDLISFSGILFGIYPPLFAALLVYAVGGTAVSLRVGRPLVALNFAQEAREADLRYSLVRVRENAEAVAFYGGERAEERALGARLRAAVDNYASLLVASRNLDFFTSFYRFLIQLLPAAVVAPLFFAGKIEFGVVNQSQSAFGHVLGDVSLVVYQLEALAGFSAVVDRLGEFGEVVDRRLRHDWSSSDGAGAAAVARAVEATATASTSSFEEDGAAAAAAAAADAASGAGRIRISHVRSDAGPSCAPPPLSSAQEDERPPATAAAAAAPAAATATAPTPPLLLELERVSVRTPDGRARLVRGLSLAVREGESLLIMGPSGAGKTSVLRSLAGLWSAGEGRVVAHGLPGLGRPGNSRPGAGGAAAAAAAADDDDDDDSDPGAGRALFLPQKPYMVLGSLRDQLLYPTWATSGEEQEEDEGAAAAGAAAAAKGPRPAAGGRTSLRPPLPPDDELLRVLRDVQLGGLIDRCAAAAERAAAAADASAAAASAAAAAAASGGAAAATAVPAASKPPASPLDLVADWAATLSLGEQQRLAFARLLLARPRLALLDEATSALDVRNERLVYGLARRAGVTLVSVGHRPTLARYHERVLRLVPGGEDGCGWRVDRAEDAVGVEGAGADGGEPWWSGE